MDPRNSIMMGVFIIFIGLYCGNLAIKLKIQKKDVLVFPVQILILIYRLLGISKEIKRIKEKNKITPSNSFQIFYFFVSGVFMILVGLYFIVDGIIVILNPS